MTTLLEELHKNKEIDEIYKNCKWTNTISHWRKIKEEYSLKYWINTIILFQVWTFFETYFHDAYLTSKLIWQTLTSKNKKEKYAPPMAWSPKFSFTEKIKKLLQHWYNVIVVEEVWTKTKNWFEREVTQILTPWTNLDNIWNLSSNFVYNFYYNNNKEIWISILDVSSNEFNITSLKNDENLIKNIENLFYLFEPKEITINKNINNINNLIYFLNWYNQNLIEINYLWKCKFEDFELDKTPEKIENQNSIVNILCYVNEIHKTNLKYINTYNSLNTKENFYLDSTTIKNLEIFKNNNWKKEYSLFNIINNTHTSFWARMLKQHIVMPLKNINLINQRLDWVEAFLNFEKEQEKIISILNQLDDIERLSSKLISNTCNPNHILSLKDSLIKIKELKKQLSNFNNDYILEINWKIQYFEEIIKKIEKYLKETWGTSSKDWNIINFWINEELDHYIKLTDQDKLENWYEKETEKIKTKLWFWYLKVWYNNLWPFIEVKKNEKVPENWKKIKMLKDYDRYETEELINFYREQIEATSKRNLLEYKIFTKLRIELSSYINEIQITAKNIWLIDILISHSILAKNWNYSKPEIHEWMDILIEQGRHPVIEQITKFSENNTIFSPYKKLHIITWPNMGWKSTYIRQIALILLLSHIWSFTPSKASKIGLIDWIFTRVGASDNLSDWESTFFVEMKETANILNNANKRSFIVLDEIWRWTSNEDWYAISQSISEYIIENWFRTVFATHYHELSKLELLYPKIENYHVDANIIDWENITFNHKVKKGSTNESYWIEIWELANLPKSIIQRAKQLKKMI